MKKIIFIVIGVVAAIGLSVLAWVMFFWQPGPAYNTVAYLEQPEITALSDELMMTVTLTGTPGDVAAEGIGTLYSAYLSAGGSWSNDIAPRGRWGTVEEFDGNTESLTGTLALPMPAGVISLPAGTDERIVLETWQYGTVAQILHVGSYDSEQPTIDRLRQYITDQGYTIAGEHEEVYLNGPNMFGFGNEEKFLTIIRYPVEQTVE